MVRKPIYEELEQGVQELGKQAVQGKRAEEEPRQYRDHFEELGEKRTVELAEANEQLKRELSDRKRAEEALARNNGEWEKTFNAISDWVCLMDLNSRILRTNVAGEKFVRVPADEMLGQKCCKLLHGSDKPIAGCPLQRMLETHQRETVELQAPDGSWLMVTADPVTNKEGQVVGAVHITRDVTDPKRAEEALRESEERFRKAFDHAALGMVLVSLEGRFLKVNSYFCQMLGYPEEELLTKGFNDVTHPDDHHIGLEVLRQVLDGTIPFAWAEKRYLHKDGRVVWGMLSTSSVRDAAGKPMYFVSHIQDITEQKRAEEEKKKLEAQLLQAQKMEAIGTLAGGIAHDFNNLLMAIQGHTSLMLLHVGPDHPHFERLKGIENMVRRGADLTGQLLGFAMGGKYEVKLTALNKLVAKSSEMFSRAKKQIKVYGEYQKDIWPVEVDQGQIEQVLLSLYLNAWHAMPRGGDLYIETGNVVLDEKDTRAFDVKPGNYVKVSVTDTGVGMDEATQQRIFEPFFTTKEMGRGKGLGLASAYGIIKNHGGFINVYSKKDEGTTFNIFLPASRKELRKKEGKLADEILKGTETVLLVDDEHMILDVGQEILKEMGYKVLLARNGTEAVQIYTKYKDEIDLVILDMVMPDMGGGEAYDRMKEISPDVKVLLSSGYSIRGEAREILTRGCDGFIQKPFRVKELSGKIREILDKK